MVRREDDGDLIEQVDGNLASRRADPAGGSPVSVSGNAPSSRLPAQTEMFASEAECRKPDPRREPRDGEQVRGPQHQVKSAASSHLQPEGRAAHVTAKATPKGLGGVED